MAEEGSTTLTKDGVTLTVNMGNASSVGTLSRYDNYRIYKDNTFTISSKTGNIVKIIFNCAAPGSLKYGPGAFTAVDKYTYQDSVGTWEGTAAESVTFTATNSQLRANSIVVVVGAVSPIISGNEEFDLTDEITIAGSEGNQIYYTLDDTEPTATSYHYTAPFSIDKTMTVKAIAENDGQWSSVVSKTFTKLSFIPETIASLALYSDNMDNLEVTFNHALVTYVDGKNIYIREGKNAIILYKSNMNMSVGKQLSGTARFNFKSFHGIPELVEKKGFTNSDHLTLTDSLGYVSHTFAYLSDVLAGKHNGDYILLEGLIVSDTTDTGVNYYLCDIPENTKDSLQLYSKKHSELYTSLANDGNLYAVFALCNNFYHEKIEIEPIDIAHILPTKITSAPIESAIVDKRIFNMTGQRLAVPQRGLNIINGKKVMVDK